MSEPASTKLFIDWGTNDEQSISLNLGDIQAANALLERLALDEESAIAAIRCAAWIRPRIFSRSAEPPSTAVKAWNRTYPPGTAVRCWPLGRKSAAITSNTASVAFSIGEIPSVLLQHEDWPCLTLAECKPLK